MLTYLQSFLHTVAKRCFNKVGQKRSRTFIICSPPVALPASPASSLLTLLRSSWFPFSFKIYQVPSFLWVFKNPSSNSYLDISCSSFRFQLKCHFLDAVHIDPLLCAFATLFTTCSFIFIFVTVCLMFIVTSREKAPWGQRVCFAYHCLSRYNAELDSVFTK